MAVGDYKKTLTDMAIGVPFIAIRGDSKQEYECIRRSEDEFDGNRVDTGGLAEDSRPMNNPNELWKGFTILEWFCEEDLPNRPVTLAEFLSELKEVDRKVFGDE